ncbi:hypothetical protein B0H14DRAFT_3485131 [Mycena olivaceomarginata]|nr:hypothetical protein B0H14DRAFT_3485131 [Mycena olivaceomarginata]
MSSVTPVASEAEAPSSAPEATPRSVDPRTVAAIQHLALVVAPPAATPPTVAPPGFQNQGPWVAGALYLVVPSGPLAAVPEAEPAEGEAPPPWYCITRGKHVGVMLNNSLALAAVVGVSRSAMKSHKTQELAVAAFNEMLVYNLVHVL